MANQPQSKGDSNELDRFLDDAYRLGKTDTALPSANDYPILMPKMKAKLHHYLKQREANAELRGAFMMAHKLAEKYPDGKPKDKYLKLLDKELKNAQAELETSL